MWLDAPHLAEDGYFKFDLSLHSVISVDTEARYSCIICGLCYKYEFSLKRHLLRNHVNFGMLRPSDVTSSGIHLPAFGQSDMTKPFRCGVCQVLFELPDDLRSHMNKYHENFIYKRPSSQEVIIKCPECKAEFFEMRSLNCHLRYHKSASWNQSKFFPSTYKNRFWLKAKSSYVQTRNHSSVKNAPFASINGSSHEEEMICRAKHKRLLRQKTLLQKSSMFTCTVCHKPFHSYGNLLRHRHLSHESVARKRSEVVDISRPLRKKPRLSPQLDPMAVKGYFENVPKIIAFNISHCIHGTMKDLECSSQYLSVSLSQSTSPQSYPASFLKSFYSTCNINIVPTRAALKAAKGTNRLSTLSSTCKTSNNSPTCLADESLMKCPEVYDKPGLWRFLCLVCMQFFPNTLELFLHQDIVHKKVKTSHLEVGKAYNFSLRDVSKLSPVGDLNAIVRKGFVSTSRTYSCTKCQKKFHSTDELHPHLVTCGKDLLQPINIVIPPQDDQTFGSIVSSDQDQGSNQNSSKSIGLRQRKITDHFKIRKKSRLELEAEEQEKLENKIRIAQALSPNSSHISRTSQHSTIKSKTIKNISDFKCPYCSLNFRYRKVYLRHLQSNCEMMKRLLSQKNTVGASKKPSPNDKNCSMSLSSQAQARVLAKFIHPVRSCGPCFTCKRPNKTRHYTHLKQRSASFVEFVVSKYKNISPESCICKDCELKFRSEYEHHRLKASGYRKKSIPGFKTVRYTDTTRSSRSTRKRTSV